MAKKQLLLRKNKTKIMNRTLDFLLKLKRVFFILVLIFFIYPVGYWICGSPHSDQISPFSRVDEDEGKGAGVYVINLNKSPDRYQHIKKSVSGLGLAVHRIEAIDGSTLSAEEIREKVDLESYKIFLGHFPKRGTVGCSLSHIKAWQTFLSSDLKFALIVEDDVSFEPSKVQKIIEDLTKNSELWDIVTLEICHSGFPLTIKHLPPHRLAVYLTEVTHTGTYLLNRKAAKKLLQKALPIKMPIDHYFTRAWEFGITFTGIENPRLVYQTFGESDIAKTTQLRNEGRNALEFLQYKMYKGQSYLIRFLYNLKLYLAAHGKAAYACLCEKMNGQEQGGR